MGRWSVTAVPNLLHATVTPATPQSTQHAPMPPSPVSLETYILPTYNADVFPLLYNEAQRHGPCWISFFLHFGKSQCLLFMRQSSLCPPFIQQQTTKGREGEGGYGSITLAEQN